MSHVSYSLKKTRIYFTNEKIKFSRRVPKHDPEKRLPQYIFWSYWVPCRWYGLLYPNCARFASERKMEYPKITKSFNNNHSSTRWVNVLSTYILNYYWSVEGHMPQRNKTRHRSHDFACHHTWVWVDFWFELRRAYIGVKIMQWKKDTLT